MKFGSDTCNPFITLACDFRCPYCITKATPGWNFGYPHRGCLEWAAALNNLEDVKHIVLNGGEPTLRPGFADMIATGELTAERAEEHHVGVKDRVSIQSAVDGVILRLRRRRGADRVDGGELGNIAVFSLVQHIVY